MANYKTGLETKEKIYATAKKLFYEKGFVKTTLAEIARESGANKAMVSYYFGNKNNLALEVYNEYMGAMKVKTQNNLASQFPDSDLFLRTAIEYRLQNRNCNRNKGLNRFYHELCDSNIFMKTESASVGFIENINKAHKLGLSRVDVKALALANLSAVHGLHVARNEGFLDCSSEYLAETEIRLLLQSLKIGNDVIEGYIEQSREIVDRIEISVGKNFKVL